MRPGPARGNVVRECTLSSRPWDRFLAFAARSRSRPLFGYGFSLATFGIALAARFAMGAWLPLGFPFLTFFPAMLLSTLVGGRGPGALCAVLSLLAAWYWFIRPFTALGLDLASVLAMGLFALVAVVNILVVGLMNHALDRLAAEQQRTRALLDQRTTLFSELQHRVANNLAFIGGLLAVQHKRLAHNPEAAQALSEARHRFDMMSRIHRRLHAPDSADVPLTLTLRTLCDDVIAAAGQAEVRCQVQGPPLVLDFDRTVTLSLLVVEVVTNALKHGFTAGRGGTIDITLDNAGPGRCVLTITDDGAGLPADFDADAGDRLGFRILRGLARSLGGRIEFRRQAAPGDDEAAALVTWLEFPVAGR